MATFRRIRSIFKNSKRNTDDSIVQGNQNWGTQFRLYAYRELVGATNNFEEHNLLGEGGTGRVFLGVLEDCTTVAIKRMHKHFTDDVDAERAFDLEVQVFSQVRHQRLVSLLGYCSDGEERVLVYEYMSQGNLDAHIFQHEERGLEPLGWNRRLRIALDIAQALEYLHCMAPMTFLHRDCKPSNILLDEQMRAKLADFGSLRVMLSEESCEDEIVAGTQGYLDPEYLQSVRITTKADVYSFGVTLAALITGRKPVHTSEPGGSSISWFQRMTQSKDSFMAAIDLLLDPVLKFVVYPSNYLETIWMVAEMSRQCLAGNSSLRPPINVIVGRLTLLVENLETRSPIEDRVEDDSIRTEQSTSPYHEDHSKNTGKKTRSLSEDDSQTEQSTSPYHEDHTKNIRKKTRSLSEDDSQTEQITSPYHKNHSPEKVDSNLLVQTTAEIDLFGNDSDEDRNYSLFENTRSAHMLEITRNAIEVAESQCPRPNILRNTKKSDFESSAYNEHDEGETFDVRRHQLQSISKALVTEEAEFSQNADLQFREDVLSLGVTSWDHKYNPECTLVLSDLTSTEHMIHFMFFHVEAVLSLFGCGLEYSIVSICLDTQKIFMTGITKVVWKKYWMDSSRGALRPFVFGIVNEKSDTNQANSETNLLSLSAEEALSKFGISIDGPQLQNFVNLGVSSTLGARKRSPSWKSWIQCVINHASPNAAVRNALLERLQSLFVPLSQASMQEVRLGSEVGVPNGDQPSHEQNGENAKPRVDDGTAAGAGEEQKALVVEISFDSSVYPYHMLDAVGEPGDVITDELCHPGERSEIAPSMTVEFSFLSPEEKLVHTTLHGLYCMDPKRKWHIDWFQDDLRISFGSVHKSNPIRRRGSPQISGKTFTPLERTLHDGTSTSEQKSKGVQGSLKGGVHYASASVAAGTQRRTTKESYQNVDTKYSADIPTLESHSFFDVTCVGPQRKMDVRAKFQFDSMEPSRLYFTHPERYREVYSSGLQSDFNLEGKVTWELLGVDHHAYDLLARKTLSRSRWAEPEDDESDSSKRGFKLKLPWRGPHKVPEKGEAEGCVETEVIFQLFKKRFMLNHNFDEFFETYSQSSAHRWSLDTPESRCPVPRIMAEMTNQTASSSTQGTSSAIMNSNASTSQPEQENPRTSDALNSHSI